MIIEKIHNKLRYTFSNENLKVGDEVYPIGNGRCIENKYWILHNLNYSCLNEEPHVIENLKHSNYKPYQVKTNHGFGPIEIYYKIIKIEKQFKDETKMFASYEWVEVSK